MKTAWLLHGTGGSKKEYFWFENTRQFLESKGYQVWWPLLPHTDKPNLEETVSFIEQNAPELDEDSIIIGHSSACPAIMYLLQRSSTHVKQVILVSGFYQLIDDEGYSEIMLPANGFDWQNISQKADEIVMINSDNDPWGCDDKQARPAAEKLGAKFILAESQGHMGSTSFNQPYREFPLLKSLLNTN
jgi:predicted alpha/beta hydrolase family esterase